MQYTTIGDEFVTSDAYQALRKSSMLGQWTTGPIELSDYGSKATVTTTASPIVEPDRQPGIQPVLFRRLTIADLVASGTTTSNQVSYPQETTATNAAAATAEGDLKPEATVVFEVVNEPVRKVATFLPVSDEMLEDVDGLRSYLNGRLTLFVEHEEEDQVLNGSGVIPNLTGLLNRTGVQTVAKTVGQAIHDVVYTAITNIRNNANLEPDGIVMHPTNWASVRTAKDANGQYYGGGPFMGPYGQDGIAVDNIWGLPVAVTSAIPVNTALVGAFRAAAQVFRRGGLTVEASNSHSDFFQRNLTAIREERRLALACYRPSGLHTITALSA